MIQRKGNIVLPIKALLLLGLMIFLAFANTVQAQCGMALKDVVLQEIGSATYLKDFRVTLEAGKNPSKPPAQEFSILLNKGTHYRFNIKADKDCDDQVILKLYDFTKLYGSNYDASDGTAYVAFDFFCAKTQVYYLSISFAGAKPGCAAAVVSFVGNYDAK
jgi:hypothetical protein